MSPKMFSIILEFLKLQHWKIEVHYPIHIGLTNQSLRGSLLVLPSEAIDQQFLQAEFHK